ncbi:toll/interleukin-1 receptor domain-containing protein [bacterium]|nr:toll/interleukin-1 receptor domain-containing protein [bacterium]
MAFFTKSYLSSIRKSMGMTKLASLEKSLEDELRSPRSSYDIFLSHSRGDSAQVIALKEELENRYDFSTYVDWIEDPFSRINGRNISKENAKMLRDRMAKCKSLVYVHSVNSETSKWMPWETGYFDSLKNRVAILPILKDNGSFRGQEYLGLYPYITYEKGDNGSIYLWVNNSPSEYIEFNRWLKGKEPYKHQ